MIAKRWIRNVNMISAHFLGFVALAVAVGGLLAVLVETAVKSPLALLDLVLDTRRMAMPEARRSAADRVSIGYTAPNAPANADQRAAA